MEHPLRAIDLRLARAKEQLSGFEDARSAFIDEKNRRIVGHFERDTSEYVFRFEGEFPEPSIGVIVGEFGHNLRAALDNLVWQLVRLRGSSPTKATEFPIYISREGYYSRRGRRRVLRGISVDDRAFIDSVQPFQGGESAAQSYLALLAWLNNVDKHRFLHVGCVLASRLPIKVSYGVQGEDVGQFPWNPLIVEGVDEILGVDYVSSVASDDRAELMRVHIRASGDNPKMDVNGEASVEISLSDPEHSLSFADLRQIFLNVSHIIEVFRPRFDSVGGLKEPEI